MLYSIYSASTVFGADSEACDSLRAVVNAGSSGSAASCSDSRSHALFFRRAQLLTQSYRDRTAWVFSAFTTEKVNYRS